MTKYHTKARQQRVSQIMIVVALFLIAVEVLYLLPYVPELIALIREAW